MKMYMHRTTFNKFILIFTSIIALTIASCEDDDNGMPRQSSGELIVQDVSPAKASVNTTLTVTGTGLGDIQSIVFDKNNAPALIVSTFNTDNAMMFSIPDTAEVGVQNIVITNGAGKTTTVQFEVLGFAVITDVSNYNFQPGGQLVLTGRNLADVTEVILTATEEEATVISTSPTELVIEMPETTVNRTRLNITNAAGLAVTTQYFVNIDNALVIFDDAYGVGFQDGSWGAGAFTSTDVKRAGTTSVAKNYQKGNWHLINFANWDTGVSDNGYNFLAFWVKGASIDHTLYLTSDLRAGGFGNSDTTTPVEVPANVWTYHIIPMDQARLWETDPEAAFHQLGFYIQGPDNQDEVFHFDDVILIKQ